jgi:hypothetical protein
MNQRAQALHPEEVNTEILTFDDDKIVRTEVYFGWNLSRP